jgi:Mrp family chromosome partitioning ATPase/multisubunit Na+/H+ antiporter MnhB subunit
MGVARVRREYAADRDSIRLKEPSSARHRRMLSMPMTGYQGMDLQKYLGVLRARRWLIAGVVGSAVVLALLMSLAQPSRYQASAELLFGRTTSADAIVAGSTTATGGTPETKAATNLALASLDTVATRVKAQLGWDATIDELKSAVRFAPRGDSDLVAVTAEWSTPEEAAALANAFATEVAALRREVAQADIQRAIDALKDTVAQQPTPTPAPDATGGTAALRDRISELELLKALESGGVSLVETATPPQDRSSPRPLRSAFVAGFVALAVALLAAAVLARFDDRISDEDELAAVMGAPVLARVPRLGSRRLLPASTPHEEAAFFEAFEFLRLNLQLTGPQEGSAVLAVTSPTDGDGKTTVVTWLASSLGRDGADVLAVDLDVRKPELHRHLNTFDKPSTFDQPGNGISPPERRDDGGEPVRAARRDRAGRVYGGEDVRAGLRQLARSGGNARRAAQLLQAAGRDISESSLRRWKVHHAELYSELVARRAVEAGNIVDGGTTTAADLTVPTLHPGVRLLTSHPVPPLRGDRLHKLFAQLREHADYVLVDTVPVSTVADASTVAATVDGVILVIDLERTRRRDLLGARKQLSNAHADLRGIVLNRAAVDHPAYVYRDLDDPLADE